MNNISYSRDERPNFQITMKLYETDIHTLQEFIANESIDGAFSEKYLILYNFVTDCIYSEHIQPELIRYLLPFYLKSMEQAVIYENHDYLQKTAMDIYFEFNDAMFFNQKNFKYAVGEKNYRYIMEYYISQTLKKMEIQNCYMLEWVSLFNTTAALDNNNIRRLFHEIFKGSLKIKYSFFQYLSVLLFKESDNLLAVNESQLFWPSDIWNFDEGCVTRHIFWNDEVVKFVDKKINRGQIEALFKEIKPFIYSILEPEFVELLCEEMEKSFAEGIFYRRKAEYLKKINHISDHIYWDITF